MMCLPPSHFDVEYHSLLACVCVLGAEREGIMFEQFRGGTNGGGVSGWGVVDDELMHMRSFLMCCQHACL